MTDQFSLARRRLFGASVAGLAGAALATRSSVAQSGAGRTGASPQATAPVRLRWLGNNSWEISSGTVTILIDPWLTRFKTGTYGKKGANPNTKIEVDPTKINPHITKADLILVTHGHYDHIPDVPYIAKKTGATIFGTESHLNMLRALKAPSDQMSCVRGGENIQFDGYTVEVLRSVHSLTGDRRQVPFPGTRPVGPPIPAPRVIADLVEGETLAYLITIGGVRIINFGGSNYDAREIDGLRPDVALVQPGGASVPDYVPRLMACLGHPRYVLPTHWDDFDLPLTEPAKDWGGLAALETAVRAASPRTEFVRLDHLETFTLG